ncbi:MAG: transcriptional repressor [Bacteroidales bacterium]|nr:transcriptional repressor [Bacteroidales bacterium]
MNATTLLHRHKLKKTPVRLGIINALQQSGTPLAEGDIRKALGDIYDRVTFYRSIQTLLLSGIVHRIVADNTTIRYALKYNTDGNKRKTDHAHFFCRRCNTVVCLNEVSTRKYKVPEGFIAEQCEVIIKGLCNKCSGINE